MSVAVAVPSLSTKNTLSCSACTPISATHTHQLTFSQPPTQGRLAATASTANTVTHLVEDHVSRCVRGHVRGVDDGVDLVVSHALGGWDGDEDASEDVAIKDLGHGPHQAVEVLALQREARHLRACVTRCYNHGTVGPVGDSFGCAPPVTRR